MKKAIVLVAALGLFVGIASATDVYWDEGAFTDVLLPGYYLEDFVGWTYGDPLDGSQTDYDLYGPDPWMFHAYASQGLWSNDGALSTNNAYDPLVITFPECSPTAVAGIFTSTDIYGNTIAQDVTVTLDDGTSATINGTGFVGFTSDVPIVSLSADGADTPNLNWAQIDHFYVGIPEPASLLLLGLGALVLRRR